MFLSVYIIMLRLMHFPLSVNAANFQSNSIVENLFFCFIINKVCYKFYIFKMQRPSEKKKEMDKKHYFACLFSSRQLVAMFQI